MKLAFQTSTSSSIRRSTSGTEGGSCVHASQLRVSCRLAPRPCHVRPSLRRMRFPDVRNHALAALSLLVELPPVAGGGVVGKAHATSADATSTAPATRKWQEVTRAG